MAVPQSLFLAVRRRVAFFAVAGGVLTETDSSESGSESLSWVAVHCRRVCVVFFFPVAGGNFCFLEGLRVFAFAGSLPVAVSAGGLSAAAATWEFFSLAGLAGFVAFRGLLE